MTKDNVPAPAGDFAEVVRWLSTLRVDVAETVGGVLLRGARPVQVGATPNATRQAATSPTTLLGYSLAAADPAGARVYLRDGWDAAGDVVAVVDVPADASTSAWFGPGGLNLSRGLYVDVVAGGLEGAVYLRGADS